MNKTKHLFIITTLIICIVWRFIADWLVQNWLAGGCNYHHSSPRDGRLDQNKRKKQQTSTNNSFHAYINCFCVIPFESKFLFQSRYMNIMMYIAFISFFYNCLHIAQFAFIDSKEKHIRKTYFRGFFNDFLRRFDVTSIRNLRTATPPIYWVSVIK